MRPVSGFDRPALQWAFVTLAVVLVALAVAVSLALWRTRAEIERLHAANLQARADAQALEARAARETAARESLALELARGASAGATVPPPTLTLQPLRTRGPLPPPPTVDAPAATLLIELRLLLPSGRPIASNGTYAMTIRDWSAGHILWVRGGLAGTQVDGRAAVSASLAGDVLKPGSYEVLLTTGAGAEVASYEVTVR